MSEVRRLAGAREALAAGLSTTSLRRLQSAWGASAVGSWTFFVVLAVYAYGAGGATAVGAAALVRMVPAGLAAPLAGVLSDRLPRRDVLIGSLAARAVLLVATAGAIAAGAPVAVVLALAAFFTIVSTAHKPAQAALIPTLAESPRQLAACNALWSAVDNAAFLVGSLIGGTLVALTSVEFAFAITALLYALALVPVLGIARDPVPDYRSGAAAGAVEN